MFNSIDPLLRVKPTEYFIDIYSLKLLACTVDIVVEKFLVFLYNLVIEV